MAFDGQTWEVLGPLLFVVGGIYLLGPELPMERTWARVTVFAAVWLIVGRYVSWRFFTTVLPAEGNWYELGWIWLCFAVELLALFDALILYITFLRAADRSGEADDYEKELRALAPQSLPSVDVYIPTYNEPFAVLEKTITGALFLDYPNFSIWILDDGRRPWLRDFCQAKGVGYITRPDNDHAKAGNINHALTKTTGEFVAIFDADFIVQRQFLMRTMGFFADPSIGIVQVPHAFYNHDPLQTNLALRKAVPDDQRFFFEAIMPSRDAWDAAFCCGSNSVTRRAALRVTGDALPTDSITEDMLLTLKLLRKGYVTRYLCERLAYGLAPEGLNAFFIQRRRWARGAIQILYLMDGPLGPGLTLMQRLLFLPTHWLTQGLSYSMTALVPVVLLWTGVLPMVNVTSQEIIFYLVPMLLAIVGGIMLYAPRQYFPLAVQVLGMFSSLKILPTVLITLFKPFGHVFKVTPKGGAARGAPYDRQVFWTAAILLLLTSAGVAVNLLPDWRIISQSALIPVVAVWAGYNVILLFIVCMIALQGNVRRGEERFPCDEDILLSWSDKTQVIARLRDLSLTGAGVICDETSTPLPVAKQEVTVLVGEVGFIRGRVARRDGTFLGLEFSLGPSVERDLLVRKLFTSGLVATSIGASAWSATSAILKSIWTAPSAKLSAAADRDSPSDSSASTDKLPTMSLVVPPASGPHEGNLLAARRTARIR